LYFTSNVLFPRLLNARNPGPMTGPGNNTYLLASNGAAVLIDAGVGHPDHLDMLDRALSENQSRLHGVLVTHDHADHASGAPAIALAHPTTRFAKYRWAGDGRQDGLAWDSLGNGDAVGFGGEVLTAIHTPGHSPDHLAFWHEPTRALFTGDLVIAGSSVMIQLSRGGNLAQYLESLERVLAFEPSCLFPAHGPRVDDPPALIRGYLDHRRLRERQVIAALEAGQRSVEAIAESIYDGLEPALMAAARENVRAHLEKLKIEGIATDHEGWRTL